MSSLHKQFEFYDAFEEFATYAAVHCGATVPIHQDTGDHIANPAPGAIHKLSYPEAIFPLTSYVNCSMRTVHLNERVHNA